nr:MAG TPA: Spi protease inhibitor [Caudoviricetes sp.]
MANTDFIIPGTGFVLLAPVDSVFPIFRNSKDKNNG